MASTSDAEASLSVTKECRSPNWVEMPDEVMVDIFNRLTTIEILDSVRKVCTTWRRICKNPTMWKVIDMLKRPFNHQYSACSLEKMTKQAVDLSSGELIDISMKWFVDVDLLDYILLSSNKLKRLCLVSCFRLTVTRLSLAVKNAPQLEELHLSGTCINAQDLEVIGQNCPQLKSFDLSNVFKATYMTCDDHACAIANSMPELRRLKMTDKEMTNDGLEAILDGCPHLESLHVRMCPNLQLDGNLGNLCMERIKDFKRDSTQKCWFHFQFPDMEDWSEEDISDSDMYDDFSETDFYED